MLEGVPPPEPEPGPGPGSETSNHVVGAPASESTNLVPTMAARRPERRPPPLWHGSIRVCKVIRGTLNILLIVLVILALLVLLVLSGTQTKCGEGTLVEQVANSTNNLAGGVTREIGDTLGKNKDTSCADVATVVLLGAIALLTCSACCRHRAQTKRALHLGGPDVPTQETVEALAKEERRRRRTKSGLLRSTTRLQDDSEDNNRLLQAFLACDAGDGNLDGQVLTTSLYAVCVALGAHVTLLDVQAAIVRSDCGGGAATGTATAASACPTSINYDRFERFVKSGHFAQLLQTDDVKDWRNAVALINRLRRAFDTADVDGNYIVEKEELHIVLASLNPAVSMKQNDLEYVWNCLHQHPTLAPKGSASQDDQLITELFQQPRGDLTWPQFLIGWARVQRDERAAKALNMDTFVSKHKWRLISLIVDTPIAKQREEELVQQLSFFEKFGMKQVQALHKTMDRVAVRDVLARASAGKLREVTDETTRKIQGHKKQVMQIACLIAFTTNVPVAVFENYAIFKTSCNGIQDAYFKCNNISDVAGTSLTLDYSFSETLFIETATTEVCSISAFGDLLVFWAMDLPSIVFWLVLELALLGVVAVRCACLIATDFGFRLWPLNDQRHKLGNALVRKCFEMGNNDSAVMGMAADAGLDLQSNKIKNAMAATIYAGKIVLLSVMLKVIGKVVVPVHIMTWANSYTAVISSCFWDTLVIGVIVDEVELLCLGVATGPEVFNEIMLKHDERASEGGLSDEGRSQVAAAIAVVNASQRGWHPSTEMLFVHAVECLELEGKTMQKCHIELFLSNLRTLQRDEQNVVLSVLLLAQILDGASMTEPRLELWERIRIATADSSTSNSSSTLSALPSGRDAIADGTNLFQTSGGRQYAQERTLAAMLAGIGAAFRNRQPVNAKMLELALQGGHQVAYVEGKGLRLWHQVRKVLLMS